MATTEVAVFEAKARFLELLVAVESGEQVTITRRGVAVARLVPATTARQSTVSQSQRVSETFAQLRAQRSGVVLDAPLATVIAEGRD